MNKTKATRDEVCSECGVSIHKGLVTYRLEGEWFCSHSCASAHKAAHAPSIKARKPYVRKHHVDWYAEAMSQQRL